MPLTRPTSNGFTLIELLIVAVVLAIFAAAVVPLFSGSTEDSKVSSAASAVKRVQASIDRHRARTGEWPPTLDRAWFQAYKLPKNPYFEGPNPNAVVNVQNIEGKIYPSWKSDLRHDHPFWYNQANGIVRIRVTYQGSDRATINLFNRVNGTSVTSWDQEYAN